MHTDPAMARDWCPPLPSANLQRMSKTQVLRVLYDSGGATTTECFNLSRNPDIDLSHVEARLMAHLLKEHQ